MKKNIEGLSQLATSRRQFVQTVAVTLAVAPLTAAQTPTPQATPPPLSPAAAAYVEVARARFGDSIKPEQWEQVRRELEGNVRNADRLRAAKLRNGDEPDFAFRA